MTHHAQEVNIDGRTFRYDRTCADERKARNRSRRLQLRGRTAAIVKTGDEYAVYLMV